MRVLGTAAVIAMALTVVAAAPAGAAASRRSSDACTHNWSGPQVCIRIVGRDNWADKVTVTWTNPDSDVQHSTAILHEGDQQQEVHVRQVGTRQGSQVVAEWTGIQLAWGKVCGSFTDTSGVWACQDVYGTGRG